MTATSTRANGSTSFARSALIPALVFLGSYVLLLALNASLLNMPPVWDAAAGLFAPAIYLYLTGHDLAGLLELAGYLGGGANVHSLDLMTHFTWMVMKWTQGDPAVYFPLLHHVHFAFAAVTTAGTYCLARPFLAVVPAVLTAALLLVFPLFAVQASYMYAEMPGAMCLCLGALAWCRRRFTLVFLWLALACMIKSFGLVLAAFLLIGLVFDQSLSRYRRAIYSALVLTIPLLIEGAKTHFYGGQGGGDSAIGSHIESVHNYLALTPDLYALMACAALAPIAFAARERTLNPFALVARLASADGNDRYRLAVYLLPLGFLGFVLTVHFHSPGFIPLTRYYTWVMPFLVTGFSIVLAYLVQSVCGRLGLNMRHAAIVLSLLMLTCVTMEALNRDGRFYPGYGQPVSSFSRLERSFEYLDFFRVQREAMASAAQNAKGRAVFVTRGELYFGSIPMMGYVDQPIAGMAFVLHEPFVHARPRDWPNNFLVVDASSNRFHGQHVIDQVLQKARRRPNFRVRPVSQHESGPYRSAVWEVRRVPRTK